MLDFQLQGGAKASRAGTTTLSRRAPSPSAGASRRTLRSRFSTSGLHPPRRAAREAENVPAPPHLLCGPGRFRSDLVSAVSKYKSHTQPLSRACCAATTISSWTVAPSWPARRPGSNICENFGSRQCSSLQMRLSTPPLPVASDIISTHYSTRTITSPGLGPYLCGKDVWVIKYIDCA